MIEQAALANPLSLMLDKDRRAKLLTDPEALVDGEPTLAVIARPQLALDLAAPHRQRGIAECEATHDVGAAGDG